MTVCKACYGKKEFSVYTGYSWSADFPGDSSGQVIQQENKTCKRCGGTGKEPIYSPEQENNGEKE